MKNAIAQAANDPRELEKLFRKDPQHFTRCFAEFFADAETTPLLQAWDERLFFEGAQTPVGQSEASKKNHLSTSRWSYRDVWTVILLSLAAGTLVKIPQWVSWVDPDWFYPRNLAGIVIGALIGFFCLLHRGSRKTTILLLGTLGAVMLFLNLTPDEAHSQTIVLSMIHLPLFLWSLTGIAYLRGKVNDLPGRTAYIRYNGELVIYSTIILIGGMVLTGLTLALFQLIDLSIEDWYLENVVVYGAVATPLFATLLTERVVGDRLRIAPLLAKVFLPLFLITLVVYLIAMVLHQKSPYTDRDFLIAFNGLLLVVLGLSVFSISERGSASKLVFADLMAIALILVTLLIDVVALSAILFRLTTFGFTANRLATLGANLLIFGHLVGFVWHYLNFLRHRGDIQALERWIARYLPAYTVWSLIVGIGFPLAFNFR